MRRFGGLLVLAMFGAGFAQAGTMTSVSQVRKIWLQGPGGSSVEQAAADFSEFDATLAGPLVGPPTLAVLSATQHSLIRPDVLAGLGSASTAWVGIGPYGLAGSAFDVHFTLAETTPVLLGGALERGSNVHVIAYGALFGPSGVLYERWLGSPFSSLLAPLKYEASLAPGEYRLVASARALPLDAAFGSNFARWTISLAIVPEPTTLVLGAFGLLLLRRHARK